MQVLQTIWGWLVAHQSMIWMALFFISEMLGGNEKIKSNSVYQWIASFIKKQKEASEAPKV